MKFKTLKGVDCDMGQISRQELNQEVNNELDKITVLTQDVGDKTTLNTVDKTKVVNAINEVNTHLKEFAINIKTFGAVGNGIVDDSESFKNAHAEAIAKGVKVYFPKGTYNLPNVNLTPITSMFGDNNTKLIINGNTSLTYANSILIENLIFENDYVVPTATSSSGSLIYGTNDVDFIQVKDVRFIVNTATLDGSVRGKTFIRVKAKNVNIDNLYCENCRTNLIVENTSNNDTESININNVSFKNSQVGIYLSGGLNGTTNFLNNVNINNATLINTSVQSTHYSQINGSDLIMAERIRNLKINNTHSEFPCERSMYLNVVENVHISNSNMVNSEGIKVVGYVNKTDGIYDYSKKISIVNTKVNGGFEKRAITLYEVRDVIIDGLSIQNELETALDVGILLERSVEDIIISNVFGKFIRRGLIHFNAVIDTFYDTYFKNVSMRNVKFMNPASRTSDYSAIRTSVTGTPSTTYLYTNLVFENIHIENQVVSEIDTKEKLFYYNASANLKGFIDINYVDGLIINDCSAWGINDLEGGFKIDSTSRNVNINTDIYNLTNYGCPSNLHVSSGSALRIFRLDSSKYSKWENIITPLFTDLHLSVNILNNHSAEVKFIYTLATGVEDIIIFDSSKSKFAILDVMTETGSNMTVHITNGTLTKISGTEDTDISNISGKLCVYFSGTRLILRNRLTNTINVTARLKYSNRI